MYTKNNLVYILTYTLNKYKNMNTLFIIHKNRLFTSDWHIFHKNIWKYEDRFSFIWKSEENLIYSDKMSLLSQYERDVEILKNDFIFFTKVFEELKKQIEVWKIKEFYCLWDFIFELNLTKLERIKELNINFYNLLLEIFWYLKQKKIKTYLILWNHDKVKEDVIWFYKTLFNEVLPYLYIENENILISHVPVNRKNIKIKDSCSNYLLWPILEQVKKKKKLINYHGHTHSKLPKELIEVDKWVK